VTSSGYDRAFLYSNGTMAGLGSLGGPYSWAEAINASGQVAGIAEVSSSDEHAFLYSNGTMTDLGTLAGSTSYAWGINAGAQVVGMSSGHAFLYSNGKMTDLNALVNPISGWTLECANAINDSGQIIGYGLNAQGQTKAFLLTPMTLMSGDANGDGRVDINDLTILLANFGQTGATWWQGDFTGDGTVDVNDLTIVLTNFGKGSSSSAPGVAAVPEPSTISLVLAAAASLLALAWRRWSRRVA
jgi:probable HAF family extracellular repeat protein